MLDSLRSSINILAKFLLFKETGVSFEQRVDLVGRFINISRNIDCLHSFDELLIPAYYILCLPRTVRGCVVEAGAGKGGSTAKLSVIAKLCGRELYVFDSFEGLPDNDEPVAHTRMGYSCAFNKGDYCGSLEEVKKSVAKFGEISVCRFVKGWFDDVMPSFDENIVGIICDVDLASSNKTCLKFLWPRLVEGGYFFSQDAHIPIVERLFSDEAFWRNDVGVDRVPRFHWITKRFGYFRKEPCRE